MKRETKNKLQGDFRFKFCIIYENICVDNSKFKLNSIKEVPEVIKQSQLLDNLPIPLPIRLPLDFFT